jgi:hypothetical protein
VRIIRENPFLFAIGTTLGNLLADAGFAATPQGLRLRG